MINLLPSMIKMDDGNLLFAVKALADMGGGMVAVSDQQVMAELPLPIAGLMSDQPIEMVRDKLDELTGAARQLGTLLPDPFMVLVDVGRFEIVPLFAQ